MDGNVCVCVSVYLYAYMVSFFIDFSPSQTCMPVCNAQSPRSTADVAHAVRMVVWCGQIFFYYLIFLYDIYFVSKRFTFVPQRGSLLFGAVHYSHAMKFRADDNDVKKEHAGHFINIDGSL